MSVHVVTLVIALFVASTALAADDPAPSALAKVGETIELAGRTVTVKAFDTTPVVTNQFSKRFMFDAFNNKAHQQLREQEKLDEVVAKGKDEFDRQVRLMDWTYRRFKRFNAPSKKVQTPLEILKAIDEGHTFNCGFYATVLHSALSSYGYPTRHIGLKGPKSDGNGSGHSILEVWSNQHRKWFVLDPTLNMYFESTDGEGVPLNAYEIRQEWFYDKGKKLVIVIGAKREKHTVKDLPIHRAYHRGFGNLQLNDRSLGKFMQIAYTPLTDKGGFDYGKMFITKDALAKGMKWHTRVCPAKPATEPYWPLNQAALKLAATDQLAVAASLTTNTPDFAGYRYRIDGGEWTEGEPPRWALHEGANKLEVVAVNKFGVTGPPSIAELDVE